MATASQGPETGLESAGSNENPNPNKHIRFYATCPQEKASFHNVLACLCELAALFWCCASGFLKKAIFQQSTVISLLIDAVRVIYPL